MVSKTKQLSILVLACISFLNVRVAAQDYKAIKTDAEYFFRDSAGTEIIGIRIDSIQPAGNDIYYYNFKQLRPTNYDCWSTDGASWLGDEVVEKQDGNFQFIVYPFNPPDSAEIFWIETKAYVSQPWRFYNYHTINDYIEASVSQITLMNFLGLSDSVKTISLQRKNAAGQLVIDPINDATILLSKNYGLIRLPKFDDFNSFPRFFEIAGKTNPSVGIVIPTFHDIYNFDIGDEFHTIYSVFTSSYLRTTISTIRIVTGKETYATSDSIKYTYHECKSVTKNYFSVDTTYVSNTDGFVSEIIRFNELDNEGMARMPYETIISSSLVPQRAYSSHMYLFNGRTWKTQDDPTAGYYYYSVDCWQPAITDSCLTDQGFINGLGGPYYYCYDFWGMSHEMNELVYYQKGAETWGTPLNCDSLMHVGMKEPSLRKMVSVSPNPASGIVNITAPIDLQLPGRFELFDLSGRPVAVFAVQLHSQVFDLSCLPAGLYSYRILGTTGEVFRGKIIRQ